MRQEPKLQSGVKMASIDFAEEFIEDMLQVEISSKEEEIFEAISLLEEAPEIGSQILPLSIRRRFGSDVRKLVVKPFDVIYQYYPESDLVYVVGLWHQRAVH